jgi:hypothetical protein
LTGNDDIKRDGAASKSSQFVLTASPLNCFIISGAGAGARLGIDEELQQFEPWQVASGAIESHQLRSLGGFQRHRLTGGEIVSGLHLLTISFAQKS